MDATSNQSNDLLLWRKINYPIFKELQNKGAPIKQTPLVTEIGNIKKPNNLAIVGQPPLFQYKSLTTLKAKIRESYKQITTNVADLNAQIIPRTQAHNRKSSYQTIDEERSFRSEVLSDQISAWRSLLPNLIRKFSRISDPRRTKSISHKITVLMMFGLFAFIFKLTSRREMNRELTGAVIFQNLQKLFPEIDSIPHADTLARMLEKLNPKSIEATHISLIQDLIKRKKFKNLLIHDCLPISVDGTEKFYRDGILQDPRWCERLVGSKENQHKQQYIYVIEANITFKNGLAIPLMTEFLYRENNQLQQAKGKQDNEITAFERLAKRLKKYFPKLKIIMFMDSMFATFPVMETIKNNKWQFMINLPKNKLKEYAKILNKDKKFSVELPDQIAYRKRKQSFYWQNNLTSGFAWDLNIHLVGCAEEYEEVDKNTGEITKHFSDHSWLSSILISSKNLHELINLGARKKGLIEDAINTEKNRGYKYKHAFSYNLNAMQCFHYLMRLGHAINAISEFSKTLKKYIKSLGCSAALKLIKETIFNPWVSNEWLAEQNRKSPQLRLQLE